jgi:cytochrome c oxidase subunit 2
MGKTFAIVVIILTIASAVPIIRHTWTPPVDISTHGHLIDAQLNETMVEVGISFLAAQFVLALFVWKSSAPDSKIKSFPGGAKGLVIAALLLVGSEVYFRPAVPDAVQIQAQAGQFAFYFRYPGADGKFGPPHPDKIDEGNQNFFGLDPANDVDSRDDIVTGELAIPIHREIHLMMHAKDVGHSFYVRELRIQQDFVPGLDLSVHFTATQIGRYEIVCTQLCGLGHYNMKAYLNVLSQEDYDKWIKDKASQQ